VGIFLPQVWGWKASLAANRFAILNQSKMKKFIVITSSMLLLFACSKETDKELSAPGVVVQSIQSPQVVRAISGSISSTINTDPSIPPMQCTGDLPGLFLPDHFLNGNSLHLGVFISQQSTLHHESCNLSIAAMQLTASVSGQIAAANGDLIYYSGNDVIDVTNLLTGQGNTGTIQGTWTITGGTGRFDEASGSITINGLVNFTNGTFNAAFSGTISY
jgi:hypothetical protein